MLLITAIGSNQTQFSGDPLACATQLTPCCHSVPGRSGHWFYPSGTEVSIEADSYIVVDVIQGMVCWEEHC